MSAELIARLNPKAQGLEQGPPTFGAISQIDIAHAIAHVPDEGARLLVRVRYAEQPEFRQELILHVTERLIRRASQQKWRNRKPLPQLAAVAVDTFTRPRRCSACRGIGERMWGHRKIVCQQCGGSTWNPYRPSELARAMGVSWHAWENTWAERLGIALDVLGSMDHMALNGLHRALDKHTIRA